jgi:hypothetical protein
MRKNVFAVVGPLLLGCALFVSGLGSAEEIATCGGSAQPAAAPDIAISAAELGQCGGKTAEKKDGGCSYKVTNTGNVKLINVRVMDERFDAVRCQKGVLAAGESMTCTASGPSKSERVSGMGGCAVADHVVASEAGVLVTTKGDCAAEPLAQTTAMNR